MSVSGARWARLGLGVVIGLLIAFGIMFAGWPLPRATVCSGDVCTSTNRIDWARVDWAIPPQRIACGIHNPDPGTHVLMNPGETCVRARGDGSVERRLTYEQLRVRGAVRRIVTLAGVAAVLGVTLATTARAARRGTTPS